MYDSLYVHVPFCHLKCDYCAFYSLGASTEHLQEAYLQKLQQDCTRLRPQCNPLRSIFIGGGTPTALTAHNFKKLLDIIRQTFTRTPDCEWSTEANPESLDEPHIDAMAHAGINRVSVGIQSFNPDERKTIGRKGSLQHLQHAVQKLRDATIRNLNVDLIYMIPGQTPESFRQSLTKALELNPQHLSAYALTLEEHTPLARKLREVDDEDFLRFWDTAEQVLAEAGLQRYEISNFARPGRQCRHNDDIWHGITYLGVGPAATSFDGTDRFTQPRSLNQWLAGAPPDVDRITPEQRACEILAFGMRTLRGWNFEQFQAVTGYDPWKLRGRQLQELNRKKLIQLTETDAKPTRHGLIFNDDVLEQLI